MTIMRMPAVLFLFALLLVACSGEDRGSDPGGGKYKIAGYVQKGPFVQGSEINIAEIDEELIPIGTSYTTSTVDDFGSFEISREMGTRYVEVTASGFYFNEVAGALSTAGINFRVVADLSENKPVNINILTTIERERIKTLINDGKSFEAARAQAEAEILAAFHIRDVAAASFQEMDISKEGDSNAILLAVSAVLQQNHSEAQLSELISKITQDLKNTGTISSEALRTTIRENAMSLDLGAVRTNLEARYASLGLTLTIPRFEDFVDSDGDGLINRHDFTVEFPAVSDADLNGEYTSDEVVVVLPPDIAEAEARIDQGILVVNGEDRTQTETVRKGDRLAIRLVAPGIHGESLSATLQVGYPPYSVEGVFVVTARAETYFSLAFEPVTDADIHVPYTSNENTVVLPESIPQAQASLDQGLLLVNSVESGDSAALVSGDRVAIVLSADSYDTDVTATLTIDYAGNLVTGEFLIHAPRMICTDTFCEDLQTGLVWQKGYSAPFEEREGDNWNLARGYCSSLTLDGKDDWRLPEVWEFRTIVRGCPETVMEGGACGVTQGCLSSGCAAEEACTCEGGNTVFNDPDHLWEALRPFEGGFWLATVAAEDSSRAWLAFPWNGPRIQTADKGDPYGKARCVRGTGNTR